MDIKIEMLNDVVVLVPVGNLVASTAESFKSEIAKLLEKHFTSFLVDMSKIDFMDSSGLGACIGINKTLAGKGGVMACCGLNEAITKIFRITRADQKIPVAATKSDGLLLIQDRLLKGKQK